MNSDIAKWLREQADKLDQANGATVERPEWTIELTPSAGYKIIGPPRVFCRPTMTYLDAEAAATYANALNSFAASSDVASEATAILNHIEREGVAVDAWRVATLRRCVHKALHLATYWGDDGKVQDETK